LDKDQIWSHAGFATSNTNTRYAFALQTSTALVDVKLRVELVTAISRELEWMIHSMSRSDEFYGVRVEATVGAILDLSADGVWTNDEDEAMEDAREVAQKIREVVAATRRRAGVTREKGRS
jgi:predicted Rdx family selenoprotein